MTDDFDDELLRDGVRARSGGPVDTGSAQQAVIARADRTRTRRTVAVGAATALVVIGGLVLLPAIDDDAQPAPADDPVSLPSPTAAPSTTDSPSTPPTTAAAPSTTDSPSTSPTTAASATTVPTDPTQPAQPAPTSPSSPTASTEPTPTTTPTTSASTASTAATTAPSSTTAATQPSDAPFTRQYDSAGGSITVDWDGATLSLVSVAPNQGYESEIEDQSSTRVRVRFRGDDDDSRIEVRVRDGQVEHTIS